MNELKEDISKAGKVFLGNKHENIRLVSHYDSDGITSAAIIIKMLHELGKRYNVSILSHLERKNIEQLANEDYDAYIFTDLGSSHLKDIDELIDKQVYVLDHHKYEIKSKNILHINPQDYGLPSNFVSGSGICYLFAKNICPELRIAGLALVGAIGDSQEDQGFLGINKEIVKDASDNNEIKIERGIKFLRYESRYVHTLLMQCSNPYIEGISGDKEGSIAFLRDIHVYTDEWKYLDELSEGDVEKIIEGILTKINGKREDMMRNNYVFVSETLDSFKEGREFSTVLNACGRIGKASIGIGACLGDDEMKKKAMECLTEYRAELLKAMDWVKDNKETNNIIKTDRYVIINSKDKIKGSIIGTISSIIAKSNSFKEGTIILGMAHMGDNTKISLRITGKDNQIDLRALLKEIMTGIDNGEYGGHKNAAGALIPISKEKIFLDRAREILSKKCIEEGIC